MATFMVPFVLFEQVILVPAITLIQWRYWRKTGWGGRVLIAVLPEVFGIWLSHVVVSWFGNDENHVNGGIGRR